MRWQIHIEGSISMLSKERKPKIRFNTNSKTVSQPSLSKNCCLERRKDKYAFKQIKDKIYDCRTS